MKILLLAICAFLLTTLPMSASDYSSIVPNSKP
jgi:hypothetical protein